MGGRSLQEEKLFSPSMLLLEDDDKEKKRETEEKGGYKFYTPRLLFNYLLVVGLILVLCKIIKGKK